MRNGIVTRKLSEMEETLRRLREHLPTDYEEFSRNWAPQKVVERALQIMIEAMIDIGERLIALEGGSPAETSVAVMERLQALGVVSNGKTLQLSDAGAVRYSDERAAIVERRPILRINEAQDPSRAIPHRDANFRCADMCLMRQHYAVR
jgi:uncharacterized protein YutE (UPF0331/DUF86 family)